VALEICAGVGRPADETRYSRGQSAECLGRVTMHSEIEFDVKISGRTDLTLTAEQLERVE